MRKLYKFATRLRWWALANALAFGQLSTIEGSVNYLVPDGVVFGSYWASVSNGYKSLDRIGWTFEFNEDKADTDAWLGHGVIDKRPGRPSMWDDDGFPRVV